MATYITLDELKTLVPQHVMMELSDDSITGDVQSELVQTIITEACEEVDGYLRGRYSLPFANTPTLVKKYAKQIARYELYARRPEGFELPPAVESGYNKAIKKLEQIRDGRISLGVPEGITGAGNIISDDGEFHVSVRSRSGRSNNTTTNFSEAIEQW